MSSPLRILVAEDNKDTLRLYRLALTRHFGTGTATGKTSSADTVLDTAADVAQARRRLASTQYEIVLVDLKLPGSSISEMGGLEVIESALAADPLCQVIVVTGYGTLDLARASFRSGVFDFIQKGPQLLEDMVAAAERALENRRQQIIRAGNPFVPISGLEPPVIAGRDSELNFFFERVNRLLTGGVAEHFFVSGDWGLGKSTLLAHYRRLAQSTGNLAATVRVEPMNEPADLAQVASSLMEGVIRDLAVPKNKLEKVTAYFDTIGINILGSGLEVSRRERERQLSAHAILHDTLLSLWEDISDQARLFVLLIDDVHRFGNRPDILLVLKSVLLSPRIRDCKLLVGLAAPERYWQQLTKQEGYDELPRFFRPTVRLNPLARSEMTTAITATLRGTGISFSPEVMEKISESSQGHPYKMQLLCYHLYRNCLGQQVSTESWAKALSDSLLELSSVSYSRILQSLDSRTADILSMLAVEASPLRSEQLLERLGRRGARMYTLTDLAAALEELAEKGIVTRSGAEYDISDSLFRIHLNGGEEPAHHYQATP